MTIDDYLKNYAMHLTFAERTWSGVDHKDLIAWKEDVNSCLDALLAAKAKIKLLEAKVEGLMEYGHGGDVEEVSKCGD